MKKLYLIMLSLIVAATAFAADSYLPILKEGRNWIYHVSVPVMGSDYYSCYEVRGTAEFDGKQYCKLLHFNSDRNGNNREETIYVYYLREENGKLYSWMQPDNSDVYDDILLIDMTPTVYFGIPYVYYDINNEKHLNYTSAKTIDRINVRGVNRKRIDMYDDVYWVEGVGSSTLNRWNTNLPLPSIGIIYELEGCYDGEELIFTADDFKAPPAPQTSYLPILKEGRNWRYFLYLPNGDELGYETYLAKGTEEICGKTYYRIFRFGQVESASDMIVTDEYDYELLAREENGQLFWRRKSRILDNEGAEMLVMDMSLTSTDSVPYIQVGEYFIAGDLYDDFAGWYVISIDYNKPTQVDTINVGGIDRKRLLGWIEGVGTKDFAKHLYFDGVLKTCYRKDFLGCYDGDELICGPEAFGMAGIEELAPDSPAKDAPAEYYNLQGIRVSEPAAGGIYIRRQGNRVSKIRF